MDDILKGFKQNLNKAVLVAVKRKKGQLTSESSIVNQEPNVSSKSDERAKKGKRPMPVSVSNIEGAKQTCRKVEEEQHSSSESNNTKDHRKTSPETDHLSNMEEMPNTKKNLNKGSKAMTLKKTLLDNAHRAKHKGKGAKKRKKSRQKIVYDSQDDSDSDYVEKSGEELLPNTSKLLLYLCIECKNHATISYDNMIEHCQDHVLLAEGLWLSIVNDKFNYYRETRQLIDGWALYVDFDTKRLLDDLKMMEALDSSLKPPSSVTFVKCDYKLVKANQWPAIFETLTKPEIDKINCSSIYNFTRIIRLASRGKASSAPFMLFHCEGCLKYVDPYSIVSHVQENSCNSQQTGFPCHKCKREFLTENAMYLHYNTHNVADANLKYKEILFNLPSQLYENATFLNAVGFDVQYALKGSYNNIHLKRLKSRVAETLTQTENRQTANDARKTIIHGTQSKVSDKTIECHDTSIDHNNITKKEKNTNIYKCRCGLCFHILEPLFSHLESCRPEPELHTNTCICGLTFDKPQYDFHCNIHRQDFTKFNIKKVTICDENVIDVKNMQHKFKKDAKTIHNLTKVIDEDASNSSNNISVLSVESPSKKITQIITKANTKRSNDQFNNAIETQIDENKESEEKAKES